MKNDDKLEEFIRKNQDEFDETPNESRIWNAIEDQLESGAVDRAEVQNTPSRAKDYGQLWKIAAMLLLMLSSVLAYLQWHSSNNDDTSFDPEFANAEMYYNQMIDQKKEEIRAYTVSNPELGRSFSSDVEHLDQMYEELKQQANATGSQEMVINAMIQNLQLRIEILNQQIKVLEQIKNKEQNENATI
ncbi:MAG: hypothetical protein AAGC88_06220 [Bacteroidota bacterium]